MHNLASTRCAQSVAQSLQRRISMYTQSYLVGHVRLLLSLSYRSNLLYLSVARVRAGNPYKSIL